MTNRCLMMVVGALVTACASVKQSPPPPAVPQGVWQIRIDVDSAPTRRPATKPVFGTINFATARYSIDFRMAINRALPNSVHVAPLPPPDQGQPRLYKITLGDTTSFDEKVVFLGRPVTADSIVGTWTETILCCAAGGRFNLWRAVAAPARPIRE